MKDLRDFIAAGKTYEDICQCLVDWIPPATPEKQREQDQQVSTAIEQEICRRLQIDVLGRLEDGSIKVFSTFHHRSAVIKNAERIGYEGFLQICGTPAKECLLKSRVDDDVPGMYGCDQARSAINLLAGFRTLSDEIEYGCGCWQVNADDDEESVDNHDSVVIVNPSEAAVYNGQLNRVESPRACGMLLDFSVSGKPWYDYERLRKNLELADDKEFRMSVYREAIELFSRWRWAFQGTSPAILAGLCLATWIQHVWAWRPQVAILGQSKSGKSVLCDALAGIFSGNCILATDTTAPGLRQKIENTMPAVIVDEADPKDKSQQIERRKILAMIRQASRGGLVLRGTSRQRATTHTLRHLFWIFGIHLPFGDEADANRVIMLQLKLPLPDDEGKLHLPRPRVLRDLGQRMLAISLWGSQRARRLAECIRDCRIDGIDSRLIESYAVPAASLAVMHGFESSERETKELLGELLKEAAAGDQPQALHDTLMHEILSARLSIGGERPSVGQCLERVDSRHTGSGESEIALAGVGVRIVGFGAEKALAVQYGPAQKHLTRGGQFDGVAVDQLLRMIPGAVRANLRIGGVMGRGVSIPWDIVESRYLGMQDSQQGDMSF